MQQNTQPHQAQQLEQLMTTVVTCRSVVKYNLALNDEQKNDLLGDLDGALEILRACLISTPPTIPQAPPTPQQPLHPLSENNIPSHEKLVPSPQEQQTLLALYRMYHSFLNVNQHTNINTFICRFNDAMATLHALQQGILEGEYEHHDPYTDKQSIEESFHRVRVFVTDIYYIFMEFMRVLSNTLQGHNVHLDTEKLHTFSTTPVATEEQQETRAMPSVLDAYQMHQHLSEKRRVLFKRITEATAFLEFLRESLGNEQTGSKREEIFSQMRNVSKLLHDLSHLI